MPLHYDVARAIFRPDLNAARQAWLDDANTTPPNEPGELDAPNAPSEPDNLVVPGEPGKPGVPRRCEATPSESGTPGKSGKRRGRPPLIRRTMPAVPSEEYKRREASSFLCYLDAQGRYADFHALRHTTGTLLAASGVNPKTAQSLMRHSDINLTMNIYTHTLAGQEAAAIATMPNFDTAPTKQQPTTPTDAPTPTTNTTDAPATAATAADTTATSRIDTTFAEKTAPATTDAPAAAPATSTSNTTGTIDNAPKPIETPPADTTAAPPKTDTKNSPPNSPERTHVPCQMLGKSEDELERQNVIAEGTKKDENIVKVELFPVQSTQPSLETNLQSTKFEIRSKKSETKPKTSKEKTPNSHGDTARQGAWRRRWEFVVRGFGICFVFRTSDVECSVTTAGGGNRTHTSTEGLRILNPARLPVPPLRPECTATCFANQRPLSPTGVEPVTFSSGG